jgi:hypothetical protein
MIERMYQPIQLSFLDFVPNTGLRVVKAFEMLFSTIDISRMTSALPAAAPATSSSLSSYAVSREAKTGPLSIGIECGGNALKKVAFVAAETDLTFPIATSSWFTRFN